MIHAVVFDIGRVILPIEWSNVINALGLSKEEGDQLSRLVATGSHYDSYERGRITTDEFFEGFSQHYELYHPINELKVAWAQLLAPPFLGIEEILIHLKSKLEIHALSNTNQAHFEQFSRDFSEFSHFQNIFTSYELEARKPEKEIFLKLMSEINKKPEEIIFLDDMPENVEAARALGIHAEIVKNSVEEIKKVLSKYNLWKD